MEEQFLDATEKDGLEALIESWGFSHILPDLHGEFNKSDFHK